MVDDDARNRLLPPMAWNAWGDPAAAKPLSDGIRGLLEQALGVTAADAPALRASTRCGCGPRRSPTCTATGWPRSSAPTICSPATMNACCTPAASPPRTCCGASRLTRTPRTPVCCPADEEQIAAVLRLLFAPPHRRRPLRRRHQRGRRTGPDPRRVRRRHLAGPASLDELHRWTRPPSEAELGAGVTGPDAERLLGEHGFSLGHFPQSFRFATIGGFAATRSSGQNSAGYGRFNDMIRGLRVDHPGRHARPRPRPRVGRRPRPARAVHRLRGRLRHHHPGATAGASRHRRPRAMRRGRSPTSPPAPRRCAP